LFELRKTTQVSKLAGNFCKSKPLWTDRLNQLRGVPGMDRKLSGEMHFSAARV
jgi:hypothetical protein